ncbi:MAG TPA: hypothetical protein VKW76_13350 [Candidatus Binatia bacterium]|nr:hypothetical protein [Candidatus Binatia bacterium]
MRQADHEPPSPPQVLETLRLGTRVRLTSGREGVILRCGFR